MVSFFSSTNFVSDDHSHILRNEGVSPIGGDPSSNHTPSLSIENDVVEVENASHMMFSLVLSFFTSVYF